ncbi:D-alanyl-D-alanine carboxypeptidase family protein [Clostridium arbusti]|uniref:D-alanyl-D-alanine carboxypeptidase family protein n=1 Tax=Clostridium arbusti TaxID=1137848 RepID=UPI000289BED6|nr:D-alanyl-D-alanine carboxypeptidase family protein [Clostridium arbusti]
MIKKNRIIARALCTVIIATMFSYIPVSAEQLEPGDKVNENSSNMNVDARSALLIEPTTGKIIYEKNSHEKFAPASVTKIMTMLITMENVDSGKIKLSDKVTVGENAKKMGGSSMILDTGEIRTVEELLKGIAIASGNDAAVAMGEYIGGSEENFAKMMNEEAQRLGMKDTNFENCTGLNAEGHLTTAYDIAIMSKELLKHPQILKYSGTYMETISEGRKSPIELVNHNKLVRFYKGCDGLKTGFTDEAKYCISATATKDGVRMLAVIMGAPTYKVRNRDASMLMTYGFSKFESKKIIQKNGTVEKVNLNKKGDKFFLAKASEDVNIIVPKGNNSKIDRKCVYNKNNKGFKKDNEIGYCEFYQDGKVCGKVKLYCDRDVKKGGIFEHFKYNLGRVFDNAI